MLGGPDLSLVGLTVGLRGVARKVGSLLRSRSRAGIRTSVGTGYSLVGLRIVWGGRWPPTDGAVIRGAPMGSLLVLLFGARWAERKARPNHRNPSEAQVGQKMKDDRTAAGPQAVNSIRVIHSEQ